MLNKKLTTMTRKILTAALILLLINACTNIKDTKKDSSKKDISDDKASGRKDKKQYTDNAVSDEIVDKSYYWKGEEEKVTESDDFAEGEMGYVAYDMEPEEPMIEHNTEEYSRITENTFMDVLKNPLSTFSIDVDKASYANVRRFLNSNSKPYEDAVRIEEMVNYFDYDYPQPVGNDPFSVSMELGECPWNPKHQLVQIGLKGKEMDADEVPPTNLVFLLDVSGSMSDDNKLPLLKKAFGLLVDKMRPQDRVSIVVYASATGVVLESTSGSNKEEILSALNDLEAGGSTAGGEGIELAYKIAMDNFIENGNNRVILATDGDFNVGVSSTSELIKMIENKREQGVFLTILGFGMGNYKDYRMEEISNAGNGNYAYIDNILEAKKMLGNELWGTLYTIAKDVKIQVEFNPGQVKAYRLIGYENRMLAAEDFNDDTKDAGEIGAGHTVTALYEIIPAGSDEEVRTTGELNYQKTKTVESSDLMTLKLRYKEPDGKVSKLIEHRIQASDIKNESLSENFLFASAVAEFGLILRNSEHKANSSYESVLARAKKGKGLDEFRYRDEFIRLVEIAELL
jgi:Ca-activated chloride channel family protein